MNDEQLIEELLVRIACLFEDASAVLLLNDTSLVERVAAAGVAVDRAAAIVGAAVAVEALKGWVIGGR